MYRVSDDMIITVGIFQRRKWPDAGPRPRQFAATAATPPAPATRTTLPGDTHLHSLRIL